MLSKLPQRASCCIAGGGPVAIRQRILDPVLGSEKPIAAPWALPLFNHLPLLARIPARLIGMGFRPEHVRSRPAAPAQS